MKKRHSQYVQHFGAARAAVLAVRDRPGATSRISLRWPGYPDRFVLRGGQGDLRTFVHVIATSGYEFPSALPEPSVIVDAGANIGLASAWFAARFPRARIVAIEPDPENFSLLAENVKAFPNVMPIRAALWTQPGFVSLVDPGGGGWALRVQGELDEAVVANSPTHVPCVDMVSLMRMYNYDHVDILKVDIEGSEKEVFENSGLWIDHISAIVIELHDRFKPGAKEAFATAVAEFDEWESKGEDTFVTRSR